MNERIEKLAMQANNHHDNFFDLNYKELEMFFEEFAELIVKECANVELYWLNEQDRKSVAEKIKQHFGVEE